MACPDGDLCLVERCDGCGGYLCAVCDVVWCERDMAEPDRILCKYCALRIPCPHCGSRSAELCGCTIGPCEEEG